MNPTHLPIVHYQKNSAFYVLAFSTSTDCGVYSDLWIKISASVAVFSTAASSSLLWLKLNLALFRSKRPPVFSVEGRENDICKSTAATLTPQEKDSKVPSVC